MIGVTIGIGEGWREVATITARQMRINTGLECHIVDRLPLGFDRHPSWLKLHAFDLFHNENEILFFDADILCIKQWNPRQFTKWGQFSICNDEHSVPVRMECENFGIPGPWKYYNAGLWIACRRHDPILKRAAAYGPVFGSWLEQTALTTELQNESVNVMPREFNRLLWPGLHDYENLRYMPDTNPHLASIGNPAVLLEIFKANGL